MATTTGSSGVVKVQVAGVTVALVGNVRSFSIDGSADTIEASVIGDTTRQYKAGLKTSTVSVECYWDETDDQQALMDEGASVDWEISPTGLGTGESYFAGTGVVTGRTITASFDGMVEASFSIQTTGGITEASHS